MASVYDRTVFDGHVWDVTQAPVPPPPVVVTAGGDDDAWASAYIEAQIFAMRKQHQKELDRKNRPAKVPVTVAGEQVEEMELLTLEEVLAFV